MSGSMFSHPSVGRLNRREVLALLASGGLAACMPASTNLASAASDLIFADAIAQADMAANGKISAAELVEAAISRIEAVNPLLNAVITTNYPRARQRARGNENGRLWGVPYLIKDLTSYPGLRYTRGSRFFIDAPADKWFSPYIQKSEEEGLIVVGKTNTPEFGLTATTESVALGPCRNPWNLKHSSGGSSGGAASAVAARLVPIAQASDGGGSIRLPAAQCGLVGLKPSRGRFVTQYNPAEPQPPIDLAIAHPVSWSVRDSALMLALTEKQSGGLPPIGFVTGPDSRRLRIAMSMENPAGDPPHAEVIRAVEKTAQLLSDMGHEIVPVSPSPIGDADLVPHFLTYWGWGAWQVKQAISEASGGRENELLERWTLDTAALYEDADNPEAKLEEAIAFLNDSGARLRRFLNRWDALLTPSTGDPAPQIGYLSPMLPYDVVSPRVSRVAAFTPSHNNAGTPAISLPVHWTPDGIPVGAQLSASIGGEGVLLSLGYELEEAIGWGEKLPPVHG